MMVHQATALDLAQHRLAICEEHVIRIEAFLSQVEALLLQAQTITSSAGNRAFLEENYKNVIDLYRSQLNRKLLARQHLLDLIYTLN